MTKQPVSVIVPYSKSRKAFFEGFVLPMIEANQPEEILIIDGEGGPGYKRNFGAKKAKGKYLLFCDDDVVLRKDALSMQVSQLEKDKEAAFCYSNFFIVNLHPECTPQFTNTFMKADEWSAEKLRWGNYIGSCSLIRASEFIEFDETLPALEDWDLWLRLAGRGKKGVYINTTLSFSYHIDKSLSHQRPYEEYESFMIKKHALPIPEKKVL